MSKKLNPPTAISSSYPFAGSEDLFPAYKEYFNQEALKVFETKSNGMIHQYRESIDERSKAYSLIELLDALELKSADDNPCDKMFIRKYSLVKCFGFQCDKYQIDDAVRKLIPIINDLAVSKWINASMYNIGRLALSDGTFVVYSYLAVRQEAESDVKSIYGHVEFPQGGTPPRFK